MKTAFTTGLAEIAQLLSRYIHPPSPGSLTWNGTQYVKLPPTPFDPGAGTWWGILSTLADIIELQEGGLSGGQREYIDRLLFGGMGSFNDFSLDERQLGPEAREANEALERLRHRLFELFQEP